jgi:hypothetical protein
MMEGRASPVQPGRKSMPGAPSFSFARYFFGLKSSDAEFMQ